MPLTPNQKDFYSYPEVTAPSFPKWRAAGAKALVTGFVQTRPDGRLTFGCYVYDVASGPRARPQGLRRRRRRLAPRRAQMLGPRLSVADRRARHVRHRASPMSPKPAAGPASCARIAVMDSDGFNHDYATKGETMVLSPRLSPARAIDRLRQLLRRQARTSACSISPDGQRPARSSPATRSASRRASRPTASRSPSP